MLLPSLEYFIGGKMCEETQSQNMPEKFVDPNKKKRSWIKVLIFLFVASVFAGLIWFFIEYKTEIVKEKIATTSKSDAEEHFNIIIIGWDGVQRDHFKQCYNQELPECIEGLSNFKKLTDDKFQNLTVTDSATSTKPGWVQILTGYNGQVSGTIANDNYLTIPLNYSLFEKVSNSYPDIKTVFLASKTDNLGSTCKGEIKSNGKVEERGEPWCNVKKDVYLFQNGLEENYNVGNKTLATIEELKNNRFLLFAHFSQPDSSGHKYGENSIEYSKGIIDNDFWLGQVLAKIEDLGIKEKTIIYVVSDHGFDENSKSHNDAPLTIYGTNDRDLIRSGDRKDITPTILKKYKINLQSNNNIPAVDGFSLDTFPTKMR